jgi:hypothetical protein
LRAGGAGRRLRGGIDGRRRRAGLSIDGRGRIGGGFAGLAALARPLAARQQQQSGEKEEQEGGFQLNGFNSRLSRPK